MSPAQNPRPQSSQPASSPQPRTKDLANSAPEPSSPAEPMTDPTSNSLLAKPPTRIKPADAAQPDLASDAVQPDVTTNAATDNPSEMTKPEGSRSDMASSDSHSVEQTPKLAAKPNPAKLGSPVHPTGADKSSSTKLTAAKSDVVKRDATLEQNPALEMATKSDAKVEAVTPEAVVSAPAEMTSSSVSSENSADDGALSTSLEVEGIPAPEMNMSSVVEEASSAVNDLSELDSPKSDSPEPDSPELNSDSKLASGISPAMETPEEGTLAEPEPAALIVEAEVPVKVEVAVEIEETEVEAPPAVALEAPNEIPEIEPLPIQTPLVQTPPRQQPIPPASEPMQYRAIGLVRGKYMPSEEQFTRGFILTDDEVLIDSVLLGRVMSLVKKHIDLEQSHLWVVYPRTRERDLQLHMQIVGIWEPEKLNRPLDMETAELESAELDAREEDEVIEDFHPAAQPEPEQPEPEVKAVEADAPSDALLSSEELDDRYFSVRGEIVYQADDEQRLLVKIRRSPKPGESEGKSFKVALRGALPGKALGYFWELQVQRENNELVVKEASQIGMVPPQKRSASDRDRPRRSSFGGPRRGGPGAGGPPRKRWDGGNRDEGRRPSRSDRPTRPVDRPSVSSAPRQPISKPIKRRPKEEES